MQHNLKNPSWKIDPLVANQLMVEETHKFLYCEVPKAGCSNWKRIIFLLKMNITLKAEYLEHDAIHSRNVLKRLSDYPEEQQKKMLETYIKVLFTRDPFQRLVSAYRDKLLHGMGYQGIQVPLKIKAMYRKNKNSTENVSFNEFVQYLLTLTPKQMDVHWRPMHYLCDPCNINYDFLGKLETVKKDSDYILKALGAPSALKFPEIKQFNESKTDTKTADISSIHNVDDAATLYNTTIAVALESVAPLTHTKARKINRLPWHTSLTKELRRLIASETVLVNNPQSPSSRLPSPPPSKPTSPPLQKINSTLYSQDRISPPVHLTRSHPTSSQTSPQSSSQP
ncbi:unnamed protein product [Ranitomeya imitator]|uniref:Carbohydrate sulfotransferase n=1 Tax=Ranitomeya imitator TaxID=111125 RepID=A0ABN9MGB7_9NEOB|nr:unnamed protein product [Ranitomeya imitator]